MTVDPFRSFSIVVFGRIALKSIIVSSLVLALVDGASAQENVPALTALPGSLSVTFGNSGPLEPGNIGDSINLQQGVTMWRHGAVFLAAFGDVTVKKDALGYSWNNADTYLTGTKIVFAGSRGVLQTVAGVTGLVGNRAFRASVSPAVLLTYWAGWQRSAHGVATPGSVWATSGIAAAAEPDNWMSAVHVEQGVAIKRFSRASVIPFAAALASTDSRKRAWNNRGFVDAGVKLSTQVGLAVVDAGIAQRITKSWHAGSTASAPVAFVNLWMGWMPRVGK